MFPKKGIIIVFPYLGNMLNINKKTRLTKALNKNLKFCQLKALFKKRNKLKKYVCFKDLVPETLRSNQAYKFLCKSCTVVYIDKTYTHMKVRVSEGFLQ